MTGAVTESAQTGAAYAAGLQEGGNRFGAVARQWLVDGVVTSVVGVAVDGQSRIRILNQSLCSSRQSALSLAAQGGAAGGECYVFRHNQLDLVALAFDFDVGVGQALTQFFLLVVHVTADTGTYCTTSQCGVTRAFAAVGQRADDAANGRTAQAVHGGFAGGLLAGNRIGHTAGEHQRNCSGNNGQGFQEFHVVSSF